LKKDGFKEIEKDLLRGNTIKKMTPLTTLSGAPHGLLSSEGNLYCLLYFVYRFNFLPCHVGKEDRLYYDQLPNGYRILKDAKW